jgi:hypothetical protein
VLSGCAPVAHYDYAHLPWGYHWRAVHDAATNAVVFYGQDPLTSDTVFVGPDNRFYRFHHTGTMRIKDLPLHWMPRDAR